MFFYQSDILITALLKCINKIYICSQKRIYVNHKYVGQRRIHLVWHNLVVIINPDLEFSCIESQFSIHNCYTIFKGWCKFFCSPTARQIAPGIWINCTSSLKVKCTGENILLIKTNSYSTANVFIHLWMKTLAGE